MIGFGDFGVGFCPQGNSTLIADDDDSVTALIISKVARKA